MVVYGGIQSVNDAERHAYIRAELDWIQRWIADDRPYLGLCLGGQLLARALDARVGPHYCSAVDAMGLVYRILYTARARRGCAGASPGGLHQWRQ